MSSGSSTPEGGEALSPRRDLPETLVVASARRPHGVRGDLLFEILSDVEERLAVGASLDLVTREGSRRPVEILSSRPHKLGAILRLSGVADRAEAEALRGAALEIAREHAPELPEGSYYFHELVGCRCLDVAEGELGVVREVREDGGGLILEVYREEDRRLLLLPFVEPYLEQVDTAAGEIRWKLPEGLCDTCASTR